MGLLCLEPWEVRADTDTWIPVVAKQRRTVTELPAGGDPVVQEVWEGTHLRDFRRSTLRKLERVQPRPTQPMRQGLFIDCSGEQGKTYTLAFRTRTAMLLRDNTPGRNHS